MVQDSLTHYGVMGMKWGVRKDRNNGHPMTKRQAKKAIKSAKRENRKHNGGLFDGSTGANINKVRALEAKARKNDKALNDAISKRNDAEKKMYKQEATIAKAKETKDHLTRLQQDPGSSPAMRRSVEQRYLKEREAAKKASDRYDKLEKIYNEADARYDRRYREIASKYTDRYKEAAVKDIGIQDTQAGIKMLEDYGLMRKATGGRVGGLSDPNR